MATEGWKPAEGMGSRFGGQVLGTFGKYGVLSLTFGRVCSRLAMLKRAWTLLSLNRSLHPAVLHWQAGSGQGRCDLAAFPDYLRC